MTEQPAAQVTHRGHLRRRRRRRDTRRRRRSCGRRGGRARSGTPCSLQLHTARSRRRRSGLVRGAGQSPTCGHGRGRR
ncbi:hypothetical protein EXE53_18235 [Halorubrum sp. SD626R]|nr:hypothetical protein EXE53_18235 [Halorubrum sp. SD626R]